MTPKKTLKTLPPAHIRAEIARLKQALVESEKAQREGADRALLALIEQAGIRAEVEALARTHLTPNAAAHEVQS